MKDTTQTTDDGVLEAAALLFQVARTESSQFQENQINSNKELRKTLTKRILEKVKSIRPDISQDVWRKASQELVMKQD